MLKPLPPANTRVSISGLAAVAERARQTLTNLRENLLEHRRKVAPTFTSSEVAKMCHIERTDLNYLCTRGFKGGYPKGILTNANRSRIFTLAEAQDFIRVHGNYRSRPENQKAIVCSVGNFIGGVGKTTMIVTIAQSLTLRGHKVCLIDLDPQAKCTTFMGYEPEVDITEEMTVMPVVHGDKQDLAYAVVPSYWAGLDLIPSCSSLFGADYSLLNRQVQDPLFEFWTLLDKALEPLRDKYDVILIDTPPTLSYLVVASLFATDGLIVPIPLETLDYALSTQFFRQLADMFRSLQKERKTEKNFEFIKIVLSKANLSDATAPVLKEWFKQTYHELLTTAEVIETDIVKNASAELQTIYDISEKAGSQRNLHRARESFDGVVDEVEASIQNAWQRRVSTTISTGNC